MFYTKNWGMVSCWQEVQMLARAERELKHKKAIATQNGKQKNNK